LHFEAVKGLRQAMREWTRQPHTGHAVWIARLSQSVREQEVAFLAVEHLDVIQEQASHR
jgi:hypothetical protein